MAENWVVLLEVAAAGRRRLTLESFESLLAAIDSPLISGLYADDRYAIQFVERRSGPEEALDAALSSWQVAIAQTGLVDWPLVRVEVKTMAEHEAEHRITPPPTPFASDSHAAQAAYQATRAILRMTSPSEVIPVLVALVHSLGGWMVPADCDDPCALPVDLTFGNGCRAQAAADPYSVARLHLEELLPLVVEDARWALEGSRSAGRPARRKRRVQVRDRPEAG